MNQLQAAWRTRLRGRAERAADAALALLLAGVALVALRLSEAPAGGRGPDTLAYALALALSLPLVFRRQRPLAILAVMIGASAIYTTRGYPSVNLDFFGPVVAYYTVATNTDRRTTWAAGAVLWIAVLATINLSPVESENGATALTSAVIIVALGVFGESVRRGRDYAARLEARTSELQAARLELAEQAVTEERLRIARDLHDSIAHHVGAILVQATVAHEAVEAKPPDAIKAIEHVQSMSRNALAEMRQLLGLLRGRALDRHATTPGMADVPALVQRTREQGTRIDTHIGEAAGSLPPAVDAAAFRLIQEALTNAVKHAAGTKVDLRIEYRNAELAIEIQNGRPAIGSAGEAAPGSGLGLAGMKERVGLLRGTLNAGFMADGSFRVSAVLPTGGSE